MDRRRANADVTTKISRMDRLPNFLSNEAPPKIILKKFCCRVIGLFLIINKVNEITLVI